MTTLERLEALHAKTTPGEWFGEVASHELDDINDRLFCYLGNYGDGDCTDAFAFGAEGPVNEDPSEQEQSNFRFCASAHNDLPTLAKQYRGLLEVNKKLALKLESLISMTLDLSNHGSGEDDELLDEARAAIAAAEEQVSE